MNPLTEIPALYRKWLYIAYGIAALVIGAIALSIPDPDPTWVDTAENIIKYLAVPFGALAGSNVNREDRPRPAPGNPPN